VETPLPVAPYAEQVKTWPKTGRHILAHFDDETIVVYQAYRPAIGRFAVENGWFGGEFKYTRMSWIKPNFLWMMYRSNWGRSEGQEVVLAIRLPRTFFDQVLAQAVTSTFDATRFSTRDEWQAAVQRSDVRLQWDPDHLPTGAPCERRAVQLGLRGKSLEAYGKDEIVEVIDMSEFVAEQREFIRGESSGELIVPVERVYLPLSNVIAERIGLDSGNDGSP
jgi:hypothetical protein